MLAALDADAEGRRSIEPTEAVRLFLPVLRAAGRGVRWPLPVQVQAATLMMMMLEPKDRMHLRRVDATVVRVLRPVKLEVEAAEAAGRAEDEAR